MNNPNSIFCHRATLLIGILSVLSYSFLAINSQSYADAKLLHLWVTSFTAAALCFSLWAILEYQKQSISITLLIGFALLFRVIGLFAFPVLEDDIYRYMWDARMTINSGSPYLLAPSDFFGNDSVSDHFDHILGLINYPDVKTVYGPVAQWSFALAYLIAPGEIWPLQLIFATADIALILILLQLAKPNSVLLYAWCPLIIKEFAFTAHPDVLGAMLLMLAVLFFNKKKFIYVGALIATAAGVKIFALIIAPFLLKFEWKGWLALFITAIIVALPFGVSTAWLPGGLSAMGSAWFFNAPLHILLSNWFDTNAVKLSLMVVLLIGLGTYWLVRYRINSHNIPRGDIIFLGLLLVSPVLNPWYLVWLLAFAAIRPSLWAWALSVSVLLSYASGINLKNSSLQNYQISDTILIVEFGSVVLLAIITSLIIRVYKNIKLR